MSFVKQLISKIDSAKARGQNFIEIDGKRHEVASIQRIGCGSLSSEQRAARNGRIAENHGATDWQAEYQLEVQRNLASGLKGRDAVRADPVLRDRYIRQANEQQRAKDAESNRRAKKVRDGRMKLRTRATGQ